VTSVTTFITGVHIIDAGVAEAVELEVGDDVGLELGEAVGVAVGASASTTART